MSTTSSAQQTIVGSYLFMRRGVGVIGTALPIVLVGGTMLLELRFGILDSLSDYYYSVMRNVFVGSLWTLGIFLICYRYELLDDIVSTVAGVCGIGVALFPTTPEADATGQQVTIGWVHVSFAACFLLILALMAIFLFRRTDQVKPTPRKQQRNVIYLICGIAILVCLGLAAVILLVPNLQYAPWLQPLHPILVIESLAICAFGFAWFVKGETILIDE